MSNTELINKLKVYGVSFSEIEKKEIDNYLTNFRKTIYNQAVDDCIKNTIVKTSYSNAFGTDSYLYEKSLLKLKK